MRKKKANISDIATAAGVSKTTVSRYLNGHMELMSEKTRDRIKTIIELLDYQPSDIARSLKLKKTNQVGIIIADMASPFSTALVIGMEKYLTAHGFISIFANSDNSLENEERIVDFLRAKEVAGVIVNTASFYNPHLISAACDGCPIILCGRYVQNYDFDIVTGDNNDAIYKMMGHLKSQGFTKPILFIPDWENNSTRSCRRASFLSAVKDLYGYDAQEDVHITDDPDVAKIAAELQRIIKELGPEDVPVIIGGNTITTVRTYKAIRNLGLKIPGDIGLCGPEDWDWQTDMDWSVLLEPNITTFSVHSRELGRKSAELLLEVLENPQRTPREITIPYDLRVRESTMRLPQSKES